MITVDSLSYKYPGEAGLTLRDLNFRIGKGEIFGFLGPSGAGKSTTQKVLTRLIRNYEGNITILGKGLDKWNTDFYEHIGVGFELPNHYSKLTALENLKFFASFYSRPVTGFMELLSTVGLEADANKKTQEFSKGMKMRLNFIRAIMHDPEILFLDEPTTGLDPGNARLIKDIILDLKSRGKTIFLTTHNMHDAEELCDRVSFIAGGILKVTDSPHNLKLLNGRRLVRVEFGDENIATLEFEMDGLGRNKDFLNLIGKERIISIHSQEAGLDDVFIRTTGTSLS
jgi:fluoroquinolone transport system ATP-binding protein